MAFSFGFFNSKGLDRTYTAENFCDYLGSIICNGIQDNYGNQFRLVAGSGLSVKLGTGKAWINGHYFINDAAYNIDLSNYMDESLPRYVGIAIVLNTADNVRNVSIEVTPGTPAENPSLPSYPVDNNKTRLLMYAVRMNPGATSLTDRDWYDYREDRNVCGYCQCILGKCKVTDMLAKMSAIQHLVDEYNEQIQQLTNKVDELQTAVDDFAGTITEIGDIGETAQYVMYSNGNLLIRGTGSTFDYEVGKTPFWENTDIKKLIVSPGITRLGNSLFERCTEMAEASFPNTLTEIGSRVFFMYTNGGLTSLTIPDFVTYIGGNAFTCCAVESVSIPSAVEDMGSYVFFECHSLRQAYVDSAVVGQFMFTRCEKLSDLTISRNVHEIRAYCITYCRSLETVNYEGTVEEFKAISGYRAMLTCGEAALNKVQCTNGYLFKNTETDEWEEVIE